MLIVTIPRSDLRDEFAMAAADEAFALSPISARAALPNEADYDAIREAFMETARGRWFLGEYAKRNRNADTSMVLDAVARIEATIAAQKEAPPDRGNELQDALVHIRGLLSEARTDAAQAVSGPEAEDALAVVNKGIRIIREIAWRLREYGTDSRICDMLDTQVGAIEASHPNTVAPARRDAVLATFDALIRRVGELGGSGGQHPVTDFDAAPPKPSPEVSEDVTGEPAEAATPSVETTREALHKALDKIPERSFDQTFGPGSDKAEETTSGQASDPVSDHQGASNTIATEEIATDTRRLSDDDIPQVHLQHSETAPDSDSAEAIGPTVLLDEDVIVAADEETAVVDEEAAHDLALLDVIAHEMAEPDLGEQGAAEPSLAEPEPASPFDAEPLRVVEPEITAPPQAVESVREVALVPETEEPTPSLGASLIASGIVSRTGFARDALAPIRRMSQAERVAFFS